MIQSGVIKLNGESKAALVYGQMNEPPGARARGHVREGKTRRLIFVALPRQSADHRARGCDLGFDPAITRRAAAAHRGDRGLRVGCDLA